MHSDKNNLGESGQAAQKSTAPSKKAKGFWGKMAEKLDKAMVEKSNSSSCCGPKSGSDKCC